MFTFRASEFTNCHRPVLYALYAKFGATSRDADLRSQGVLHQTRGDFLQVRIEQQRQVTPSSYASAEKRSVSAPQPDPGFHTAEGGARRPVNRDRRNASPNDLSRSGACAALAEDQNGQMHAGGKEGQQEHEPEFVVSVPGMALVQEHWKVRHTGRHICARVGWR